jgi:peptidoglycan hydrolase-like protein with peptidoglycan-binding domain/curli biogenesis system outer membrane secretion channel CsgG
MVSHCGKEHLMKMRKSVRALALTPLALYCGVAAAQFGGNVGAKSDAASVAAAAAAPKTPAIKTVTNFSSALRCMDELFLAFGKKGIVITSTGIPDETGKVKTGTKEMMITAISKMTVRSEAFEFIDFHGAGGSQGLIGADDLSRLFDAKGTGSVKIPDFYIRGSITQMDDNAIRKGSGVGISAVFFDFGTSKDLSFDVISMDMSVGDAATRRILPTTSTSNTMVIAKSGRGNEGGGKLGKIGFSFNLDFSKSEGLGATTRTMIELGLIETLGKFTQVPYWRCLDADVTNPVIREQALEGFEMLKEAERVTFIQRKLSGSMNRYKGPVDGKMNDALKEAILKYQADVGLVADGRLNFDLYASLLDDVQNSLAAEPVAPPPRPAATLAVAPAVAPAAPAAPAAPSPVAATPAQAPTASSALRLQVDSDRGPRPQYRVGEFLNMTLSLSNTGMVNCYYQDIGNNLARVFPNQFAASALLRGGSTLRIPNPGFKIRFDQPGTERVVCVASDLELVMPPDLKGVPDLRPLPVRSVDELVAKYRKINPSLVVGSLDINVAR